MVGAVMVHADGDRAHHGLRRVSDSYRWSGLDPLRFLQTNGGL